MTFNEQLKKTEKMLKETQAIWSNEPLFQYPNLPIHTQNLLKELINLKKEELISLENLANINYINGNLYNYFQSIKDSFINLDSYSCEFPLIQKDINGISLKKSHEIRRIMGFLKRFEFKKVIDIGSGKGHLSFIMAKYLSNQSYVCIDQDEKLQESAKKSFEKVNPRALKKLQYKALTINENSNFSVEENDLLLGLHACGDLSVNLLNLYNNQAGNFLNFPCCYHKCSQLNLSGDMKLELNHYALTLANRSNVPLSLEVYNERYKIKSFRYTLEMAYYDKHGEHLKNLGPVPKDLYNKSFDEYLNYYEFNNYPQNLLKEYQEKVHNYILLETLRNPLGRLLEQYILLDRALYLEQNGKKVELCEVFDNNISPRNIALFCKN